METSEVTYDEMVTYLSLWATKNHARLELEGEVGIMRECVGIVASNGAYPDWDDWEREGWGRSEAAPPDEVKDAYHKHPCLAVLGRGEDALRQLYAWVRKLDANGVVIAMKPRKPANDVDLLFHGAEKAVLTKAKDEEFVNRLADALKTEFRIPGLTITGDDESWTRAARGIMAKMKIEHVSGSMYRWKEETE